MALYFLEISAIAALGKLKRIFLISSAYPEKRWVKDSNATPYCILFEQPPLASTIYFRKGFVKLIYFS